ncbi:4Fe-4S dicluster domain-containing protein [archaeon]|nr:4Fe-4S dicluster domain-containing protein [archaeon]
MIPPMLKYLIKQLFTKPFTNLFPANRVPNDTSAFLAKGKITPPIPVAENYRGKLSYEHDKCIGCYSCIRVCPANVIKAVTDKDGKRKIKMDVSKCTFCGQCIDVCPVKCLHSTPEFLLADYDKKSKNLTLE